MDEFPKAADGVEDLMLSACHTLEKDGASTAGPNLHGVFGRKAGDRPRYNYSNAMRTATLTWDAEKLDHWLENPRTFLPGNKMTFPGLPDATDRRDVIAFLNTLTDGYKPESDPTQAAPAPNSQCTTTAAHADERAPRRNRGAHA